MKKIKSLLLTMTLVATMLAGCAKTAEQSDNTGKTAKGNADTITVTDVFDREVTVPKDVKNAVALGSSARLMCYMDCMDKVVGVTEMDIEKDALKPYSVIYTDQLSKCQALASGGSEDTAYTESIVALNPDVIFFFDSDTAAMEELAEKTGLPVVGVYAKNAFDQTFYDSLTLIGQIMDKEDRAEELVTALKGWYQDLQDRTKDIPDEDKPTVYTGAVNWSGSHGVEGSYVKYLPLEAVNAKNVVNEVSDEEGYKEISKEQITKWNPDYIFLTVANMDIVNEDYATNPKFYDSLSAVQNGKVFSQVSFNYYWCNLELAVIDSYYCGSVLYPEKFSDVNFEDKADEVFKTMLGKEFLGELAAAGSEFKQLKIGK